MTTLKWCSSCDELVRVEADGTCGQCDAILDPVAAFDEAQIVEDNWRPCITWDLTGNGASPDWSYGR